MKNNIGIPLLAVTAFLAFSQAVSAKSHEEPMERLVLTLLAPKIQEQINLYYQDKLTASPTFSPFLGGTELTVNYQPSDIDVKVTVIPYVGSHLDVGVDSMKFRIDNTGTITVLEYKHVRDYELLPNWQHIVR